MLTHCKPTYVALACVFGATMVLSGCKDQGQASQSAQTSMPPIEVQVITLKSQTVRVETTLNGRTSAYNVAEVRPQVNGILLKRLFEEGQQVKAGDQLYQIDPATYEAALKSAEATLAQARATLVQARADAKRSSELVKVNAISKQSDDAAQAAYKTAQASVKAAEAAVVSAKIDLDYTKVRSPISGIVSRSEVTEGALMTAYQTTAITNVQQLDPIYVDVTQTAEDLLRYRREIANGSLKTNSDGSASVTLTYSDGTPYSETGKLTFTDAQVEESTGSVRLRAVFPNPNQQLLPGLYVRAKFTEGTREDGILVRMQSVMRDTRGNPYVYVVTDENKIEQRTIKVSQTVGECWLVDSGLKAGERVVYAGFQRINPGTTVTIKEVEEKDLPSANPVF